MKRWILKWAPLLALLVVFGGGNVGVASAAYAVDDIEVFPVPPVVIHVDGPCNDRILPSKQSKGVFIIEIGPLVPTGEVGENGAPICSSATRYGTRPGYVFPDDGGTVVVFDDGSITPLSGGRLTLNVRPDPSCKTGQQVGLKITMVVPLGTTIVDRGQLVLSSGNRVVAGPVAPSSDGSYWVDVRAGASFTHAVVEGAHWRGAKAPSLKLVRQECTGDATTPPSPSKKTETVRVQVDKGFGTSRRIYVGRQRVTCASAYARLDDDGKLTRAEGRNLWSHSGCMSETSRVINVTIKAGLSGTARRHALIEAVNRSHVFGGVVLRDQKVRNTLRPRQFAVTAWELARLTGSVWAGNAQSFLGSALVPRMISRLQGGKAM